MRIDQVDPMVMMHIETAKDGQRSIRVRGILRGANVASFEMPLNEAELTDLRGHASELCARTIDALTAIAHPMPDDTEETGNLNPATAVGRDLDAIASLAGATPRAGVLEALADQLGIPQARMLNAYNAMMGRRQARRDPVGGPGALHPEVGNPQPPHRMMRELPSDDVDRAIRMWSQLNNEDRDAMIEFVTVMHVMPADRAQLRRWNAAGRPQPERADVQDQRAYDEQPPRVMMVLLQGAELELAPRMWLQLPFADRAGLIAFVETAHRLPRTPDELRVWMRDSTYRGRRAPIPDDLERDRRRNEVGAATDVPRVATAAPPRHADEVLGYDRLDAREVEGRRAFRARHGREPSDIRELRAHMLFMRERPAPTSVPSGGDPAPR